MEKLAVTVSSKGQIAIPRPVRDELNIREGTRLCMEVRGHEIVMSKEPAWKKLEGAAAGRDLMTEFMEFRQQEREREQNPCS